MFLSVLTIISLYISDNSDVIKEASTCRLSIDIKKKSRERDEVYSVHKYLDDINEFNCVIFDGMDSSR